MTDTGNLALLGRVMGGLVVVLVLIGLAARVARRARGHRGTSGLRVIDRIGLTREANLTVVEVANRVLLLGVTAQGVTLLADLDPPATWGVDQPVDQDDGLDLDQDDDQDFDRPGPGIGVDPEDQEDIERALRAAREQTLANQQRGISPGLVHEDTEPPAQRRPVPTGVALDQYPDLASALRAAGRTSEPSSVEPSSVEPSTPRTRAQARAEARARASVAAQAAAQAPPAISGRISTQRPNQARAVSSSSEVERIPVPRSTPETTGKSRAVPRPAGPASGSVLSPRTWRQGIEALRDLTVRRG